MRSIGAVLSCRAQGGEVFKTNPSCHTKPFVFSSLPKSPRAPRRAQPTRQLARAKRSLLSAQHSVRAPAYRFPKAEKAFRFLTHSAVSRLKKNPKSHITYGKLDFRVRTTCFRCLGKVRDFDQWEIRTWELLAGEIDQSGGRCVSEPPNITHSPSSSQRVSNGDCGAAWGLGPGPPLGGGLFSFGGSIQQSCGLLHGEERRPPGKGLEAQRGVAGLGFLLMENGIRRTVSPNMEGDIHTHPAAQVADCEDGWGMDLRVI